MIYQHTLEEQRTHHSQPHRSTQTLLHLWEDAVDGRGGVPATASCRILDNECSIRLERSAMALDGRRRRGVSSSVRYDASESSSVLNDADESSKLAAAVGTAPDPVAFIAIFAFRFHRLHYLVVFMNHRTDTLTSASRRKVTTDSVMLVVRHLPYHEARRVASPVFAVCLGTLLGRAPAPSSAKHGISTQRTVSITTERVVGNWQRMAHIIDRVVLGVARGPSFGLK